MFFQKILKGIVGLSREQAEKIVLESGIISNWWRRKGDIYNAEIQAELTEDNLLHHLNDYDIPLPAGHRWAGLGATYGDVTAFISTTAGAIQRDSYKRTNVIFDPFLTALGFATNSFSEDGWIFYAYVLTLGKQSIPLQGFSEEVRELHIYQHYLPYHHEGEITAKVCIPSVMIEKAEFYQFSAGTNSATIGGKLLPSDSITNPNYARPNAYLNIREVL